ncbi:MAG: toprim domain-containing protein [Euryarchaeota archaeon]|nr:toprim domain-containing protein [Euryarchaeota archaeon]
MTARNKDAFRRYEMIEHVLHELIQQSDDGAAIVVEGQRDVASLRNLGICGAIVSPSGKSLLHFAEMLACTYNSVIVLTDWDRRGDELSSRITRYLQSHDVTTDTRLRTRLRKLVQKDIKDVQGLDGHILRLQQNIIKYVE